MGGVGDAVTGIGANVVSIGAALGDKSDPLAGQQERNVPVEVGQQFPNTATPAQAGYAAHEEFEIVMGVDVGATVGTTVCTLEGVSDGNNVVGLIEGGEVIASVGIFVGEDDGFIVVGEREVGLLVGDPVVTKVRGSIGFSVSRTVGRDEGMLVGLIVDTLARSEGTAVGALVSTEEKKFGGFVGGKNDCDCWFSLDVDFSLELSLARTIRTIATETATIIATEISPIDIRRI